LKNIRGIARVLAGVCIIRLLIMPAIGTALVFGMIKLQWLPDDPVMHLVVLLEFATPPNIFMIAISQLLERGQQEMGSIMFWTYIFSIFTLMMYVSIFVSMLA